MQIDLGGKVKHLKALNEVSGGKWQAPKGRHGLAWPCLCLLLLLGCAPNGEPTITAGVDGCASCGMLIDKETEAAAFTVDRDVHTFCSPGCLLEGFERRRQAGEPMPEHLYFHDYAGGGLQRVEDVTFLVTEHLPTVMGWGILAFADAADAREHRRHDDELLVDWRTLRTLRGKVDRSVELVVTDEGLQPAVLELTKGELVDWIVRGEGLTEDVVLALRGYEELGEVAVPASGETVHVRLLASRPGDGFPIVRLSDGQVLGRVRVHGAHTSDEEEM